MSMSAVLLCQFVTSMLRARILEARIVVPANLDILEMEKIALVTENTLYQYHYHI